MSYIEVMLWKAGAILVVVAIYRFIVGFTGRG